MSLMNCAYKLNRNGGPSSPYCLKATLPSTRSGNFMLCQYAMRGTETGPLSIWLCMLTALCVSCSTTSVIGRFHFSCLLSILSTLKRMLYRRGSRCCTKGHHTGVTDKRHNATSRHADRVGAMTSPWVVVVAQPTQTGRSMVSNIGNGKSQWSHEVRVRLGSI
ncbi:uncharacterized protein K489DRAFT_177707 [Dissoconium aciculare CBS 342.82]|uniref:Uncharacterized protein n=1 Tax=Dissoconium aciculare CBS 342.82 TaxID=1314786 RepID=A0A6J3M9D7_9PEZI|nr:uncharacterized protein K489DRAFT_177707 [Dissoconium aciculare CBS 342.82]KAF1824234.1 hypothetical protein K489DRAFT_177707 [Dissoconium aciculare CBS 342.82]